MNQNSKMLAISNEAVYVPLVLRNPLSSLVTALPYIDEENDNNMNLKINGLIEDEMKKLDKHKNYLESLPEPKFNYINSQEFNSEIDRIKNDKEIIANLMKRYQFDDIVPLDKTNDPLIWKKLSDHLATLYQYNNMKFKHYFLYFRAYNKHFLNRLFNVELMMKYGPENWKKYVENSDNMVKKLIFILLLSAQKKIIFVIVSKKSMRN